MANGHGTALFSDDFHEKIKASGKGGKILALSRLLSQVCGDAITDMLAAEIAMRAAGWSVSDWIALYADLPSRRLKVSAAHQDVPGPDKGHKPCIAAGRHRRSGVARGPARCFVRPSGTEPFVRVYAEAAT